MVVAVRQSRLVARDAVADVDALDEPQLGEERRAPGRRSRCRPAAGRAKRVEDLLRATGSSSGGRAARRPRAALRRGGNRLRASSQPCSASSGQRRPQPDDSDSRQVCIVRPCVRESFSLVSGAAARARAACGGGSARTADETRVVAAFYPLAFAAERVGGRDVRRCTNLTPPGAEPHDFELTPRRRRADPRGRRRPLPRRRIPAGARGRRRRTRAARWSTCSPASAPRERRGAGGRPTRTSGSTRSASRRMVERIGAALDRARPRRTCSRRSLRRSTASTAPASPHCARREIVTSHAAFGYLADALRARADRDHRDSPGGGAERQATSGASSRRSREHGATTVFFETLVSPRLAETVAREAGADDRRPRTRSKGSPTTSSTRGEGYFSVMRANLGALRRAPRMPLAIRPRRRLLRLPPRPARPRRRRPRGRARRVRRDRRPERRRQDDARPARSSGSSDPTAGTVRLFGEPAHRFSRRAGSATSPSASQLGVDAPATVREVVSAGRLAARRPARTAPRAATARSSPRRSSASGSAPSPTDRLRRCPAASSSARSSPRRWRASPRCSCSTSRRPASTPRRRRRSPLLLDRLHRELGVTILYVSHEFGAVERFVERLVLVRGGIVFDGPPDELPGLWHDPSHVHA